MLYLTYTGHITQYVDILLQQRPVHIHFI